MQTIPGRDEGGLTLCSRHAAGLAPRACATVLATPPAVARRRSASGHAALGFTRRVGARRPAFTSRHSPANCGLRRRALEHDFEAEVVWQCEGNGPTVLGERAERHDDTQGQRKREGKRAGAARRIHGRHALLRLPL